MTAHRLRAEQTLLVAAGSLLAAFLAAPLLALVATMTPAGVRAGLTHPLVWPALRLSLATSGASLVLVVLFGTPLAWTLARGHGRVRRALETVVQLPIVIPPAVAGVAMLLAFGRRGVFAGWLYPVDWSPSFTTAAVVMAQIFVAAPYFVQAATDAFRRVDDRVVLVARSVGASPGRVLLRIALPLAAPGVVAGAAMSWARALGEFGATLLFAGNMQGRTQTLPLAIYTALEADLRAAQALSILLVAVACALLLAVRGALSRAAGPGGAGR